MSQGTVPSPTADIAWCHDVIGDVSRTFALSIGQLEAPIADELCVGYLLCRVADTIEDAQHIPPDEKTVLLETYRGVLGQGAATATEFTDRATGWMPESRNAEWELVAETDRLVATFEALPASSRAEIGPPVDSMLEGMGLFVDRYADEGGLRVQTFDELEQYCWYVAGTVGELVTGLVTRDTPEADTDILERTAASFGLLLQLVNVTKDIAADYETENNVYVPEEVLDRHGLAPEDIGDAGQSESFAPVVRELADRAECYVDDARTWLEAMPETRGNRLIACALPFLLAVGTLRELKERPGDVITDGDVKVSREEVLGLVGAFGRADEPSLAAFQAKMETGAFSP